MQCADGNVSHENQEKNVVIVSNLYRYLLPCPNGSAAKRSSKPDPSNFCVPFHESRCKTPPIIPRPCRPAGHAIVAPDRGFIIPSDTPRLHLEKANHPSSVQVIYREDMALVTSLLRASSFFLRSSDEDPSISSCSMASASACSIFSF